MSDNQSNTKPNISVLASDLDGTLIPLQGNTQNQIDLQSLTRELDCHPLTMVYVTGRHLESAVQAMECHQLPKPDWIISDVGTSIYQRDNSGQLHHVEAYHEHQGEIVSSMPLPHLRKELDNTEGLRLQEPAKQGRFKLSFYVDANKLEPIVETLNHKLNSLRAPWTVIASVDPFNGDGLVDLLPHMVSKSYALAWWAQHTQRGFDSIVFAGDSGNDLTALTAGYRTILVGNASQELITEVQQRHRQSGWIDRLYIARGHATTGVLEGCRKHGLFGGS